MSLTVAHVNVAKAYRGGERQTELLIRELARRGVRQVLVARRGAPLEARVGALDVEVRAVGGGVLGTFAATRDVDVVHVHEGRSVYAAYLRRLVSGTPYILTRRVNNPIGDHFFAHKAYRGAAFVAAVAPQVGDVVRAYDTAIDVRTVHSSSSGLGSDPGTVAAIRSELPGSFVIGHVGALDNDQKGQEFVIAVARAFAATRPEVCFLLVGSGRDEAMLKAMAADLPNVVFTGFVDNVGDFLAAIDVFVLPSRREGIGSILLDAMDFGLPIVATRVGGVPAIVRDDENGILIDAGDVAALEASIVRLLDSEALRQRLGERGREISAAYSADVMADKYLDLYRAAVRGSPAGH